MGGLLSDITGTQSNQSQHTNDTSQRYVNPRQQQAYDVLMRGFLGQLVKPPETAISVPQQQAISQLQQSAGGGSASLADRLTGAAPSTAAPAGQSYAPTSQTGMPQAGLQTRQELGLPDRSSYFTFMPSPEDIAKIGLPQVRAGTQQQQNLQNRADKLQQRIDTRTAAGKNAAGAQKKLSRVQGRQAAAAGDPYMR